MHKKASKIKWKDNEKLSSAERILKDYMHEKRFARKTKSAKA